MCTNVPRILGSRSCPARRGAVADRLRHAAYAADFAVWQSDTHQISHTEDGVLGGIVAFEGSTQVRDAA